MGKQRRFQVDTWHDSASPLLICGGIDLRDAVFDKTRIHRRSLPCAPYPSSAGSPMLPLASVDPAAPPGRSTVHRWGQAAAKTAGAVLKRLDHAAKTLVLVGCLDEIFFHRRPILVGVEPTSMVWFLGTKAANCQGATWFEALQPWTALRYVVSDAGSGLQAGIAQTQEHRRQTDTVPLEKGLDVFHTQQEARRVLSILWSRLERLWEQAEASDRAVVQAQRQGRDSRGLALRARAAWEKVKAAF